MARKKNRGFEEKISAPQIVRWKLGEYIRLSKEDINRGKDSRAALKTSSYFREHFPVARKGPPDDRHNTAGQKDFYPVCRVLGKYVQHKTGPVRNIGYRQGLSLSEKSFATLRPFTPS